MHVTQADHFVFVLGPRESAMTRTKAVASASLLGLFQQTRLGKLIVLGRNLRAFIELTIEITMKRIQSMLSQLNL